ncbi:MAG: glycosyltransferase 87 family protein, partial [Actinomycetota bacterium]|nr:glycosyltransferase 87 family protein [Actinomycetota bacterium]
MALAAAICLTAAAQADAKAPDSAQATDAQQDVTTESSAPPVSGERATEIARTDANVVAATREHPDLHPSPNRADSNGDWEVGFFSGDDQLVQVVVDDQSGEIRESWTGSQVAWRMARGYPGAFGRAVNAPWVWIPLCAIFVLGLLDWRRPLRVAHLDLVVIVAGFGLSHYFFNRGEIGLSVPLAYPPLLYLLGRMLWVAFRGGQGLRPSAPWGALAVALVFVVGVRVGLNIADSNVIDVGYSGVIGADKISDGEPLYGEFPPDNSHGDTYGPLAYYVYIPFEQILPWSGDWDELPAAHAAAIFFDLATIGALLLLGRRLRPGGEGTRLGVLLAFGWAACPYTAFALESNTNDSLVSMLLVGTLLLLSSPPARGALLGLATMTKFAPVALAPLFATYRDGLATRSLRTIAVFGAAFALAVLGVLVQTLIDPGLSSFWENTIANQAQRDSPFSIWGQEPSLGWLHTAVKGAAIWLALLVAFVPRRRNTATVAALGTAVLIAVQLTIEHWFYLY